MTSKLGWIRAQITSSFWYRVSLFALAALVVALVAYWAGTFVHPTLFEAIKPWAAREILAILASSMLLMATFSLGTMVTAYAAAASSATPRATKVLIDDPLSQNVLATFLGAFVFAIVGLVGLSLGLYTQAGEVVLILAAAGIMALVIATLFGWLDHLANMVRLGEIIRRVAARGDEVLTRRAADPLLGGAALGPPLRGGHAVSARDVGFVQHVDIGALQKVAEDAQGRIAVPALPGRFVDPGTALAHCDWPADADALGAIRNAFSIGPERSFHQDPRFCLVVLAEIASRALSPGINDPGTAIAVIAAQHRLLSRWADTAAQTPEAEPACPRVLVAPLDAADLIEDAFGPVARDGAGMLEVGLRLQRSLASLAADGPGDLAAAAEAMADRARRLADGALVLEEDRERLARSALRPDIVADA